MIRGHWRYPIERRLFLYLVWLFLGRHRRLTVRGLDTVPRTGPLIVVGNHVATLDPPLVGALLPRLDVHYMAKAESFRTAWGRYFVRGFNGFPVVRHTADRASLLRALAVLRAGHVLVIYPEGARSPNHALTRAYAGVGFLARRSGAPIVCAAVAGSEAVLPKGSRWPRGAPISLVYGAPETVEVFDATGGRLSNQAIADCLMQRLANLLPDGYRGVYCDDRYSEAAHPDEAVPAA